jgi:CubicO group peptidase (beta-lactamase class C family)
MLQRFLLGAFFTLSFSRLWAQTPEQLATLEKELEAERAKLKIPGMSVAIVKNDKVIFSKGFGYKDIAHKLPVTPDTLFAIGSSTKAFTATSVMMAVDAGKVKLDDSPHKYLTYFKMRDPETDAKITVRDLMRHSSGLARTDLLMLAANDTLNKQEMIQAVCTALPTAKLGAQFQYQNIMFSAAGEIASGAFGKPYEAMITDQLFTPLGMKRSNLTVGAMQKDSDYSLGYNWDAESKASRLVPMTAIDSTAAAGAINSSASEMTQWLRLMLGKGVFEGKALLSESSFAEMTKQQIAIGGNTNYGFGWFLNTWKGHKKVEHGGNIFGFNANVAFLPEENIGVVVLTNVSGSPLAENAANIVWKNIVKPKEITKPAEAATPPAATLPASNPALEAGVYEINGAPVKITVTHKDGKLTVTVPGQPPYPLISTGGRGYKLGEPAPEGFAVTFRSNKDKPTVGEMELKQPNATFICTKSVGESYKAPLSTDQLLTKMIAATGGMIAATGGEKNIKRHTSLVMQVTVDFANQGLSGTGTIWGQAPNRTAQRLDLVGASKKLGWLGSWFDGTKGASGGSFIPLSPLQGRSLIQAKSENYFLPNIATMKKSYSAIKIVGTKSIGLPKEGIPMEECYVVEVTPQGAKDPNLLYVSTKTFLPRRTDNAMYSGETRLVSTTYLTDYRTVEGVVLSFKTVADTPGLGKVVQITTKATFDQPIPTQIFTGPSEK